MKKFIHLLLFVVAGATSLAQTRIDVTLTVDSVQREFIISQPTGPIPPDGYPVVFMFHGTSQNGELFWAESQWKEKGEAEKFIAVFPTGLRYCVIEDGNQRTTTKWHNGELEEEACPGQYLRNDLHFVQAMIDTIRALYPINNGRIFATGFSNGAGFASKLAVEMSDLFSAVAVCGGGLSDGDSAEPVRNIPVWFALGTLDDKWLAHYTGITEFPFNDSAIAYLKSPLRRFLDVFALDTVYVKTETNRTLTYHFETPSGGKPATEFNFTLINNMFHVYPNGNNNPIVAANIFWEFFSRTTSGVPVSPPVRNNPADHLSLHPNPASDYIVVDGQGEMTLTLRTLLGETIYTTTGLKGERLAIPNLARGAYLAEISDARTRFVKMVVLR